MIAFTSIRWRLNDPGIEWRQRWTRVHRVSVHNADLTRCHILIPEHAYDTQYDEWIPTDAPTCKRCASVDE